MLKKIVSGGQTGVDRAALDAALDVGFPCGGWCPLGRRAEDGPLHRHYPLEESRCEDYEERTDWNVRDSDATLILAVGPLEGGTLLTRQLALKRRKPCLVVDLDALPSAASVRRWLAEEGISTLNIAGPRESKQDGIYRKAKQFVQALLSGEH